MRSLHLCSVVLIASACGAQLSGCASAIGADAGPDVVEIVAIDAHDASPSDDGVDAPDTFAPLDTTPSPDVFDVASTVDDSVDAAVCNATVNDGPVVTATQSVVPPPTPTGGTILPGHYQLTSMIVYGALPPPVTTRESMDITATTMDSVASSPGMPDDRVTLSYTASGTTLTRLRTCPSGGISAGYSYSADATHLSFLIPSAIDIMLTYTLH